MLTEGSNVQLTFARLESPLGTLLAATVESGLCLLEFLDTPDRWEPSLRLLEKETGCFIAEEEHQHLSRLRDELTAYFSGKLSTFSVPLYFVGTEFQKAVWQELLRIPYGATRSYKQQAVALKNLPAIRAVAGANGRNRLAIVVPCHRVIGDDGSLTGYGGGLWRKKWLLELERNSGLAELEAGGQLRLM